MLDENLPTFLLRPPTENDPLTSSVLLSQYGDEATPAYTLRRPDPNKPEAKNCYSIAIFDSYNPDIVFGEVLLGLDWSQPTLSAEEIRRNGGVPPPPQPIVPNDFTIQLYNPDQQVVVRQRQGGWGGTAYYEFELPVQSFRQPSSSSLDKSQNDPAASSTTPKISFKWKRDGKLSKDMICQLSGKSTNSDGTKKRQKEPDIIVAIFKRLQELTVMESNMYRVDVEDVKGLEVVLLISAAAIRDIVFGNVKEVFNVTTPMKNSGSLRGRKGSSPTVLAGMQSIPILPSARTQNLPPLMIPGSPAPPKQPPRPAVAQKPQQNIPYRPSYQQLPPQNTTYAQPQQNHRPPQQLQNQTQPAPQQPPPNQWAIDAETARLQKMVLAEEKAAAKAKKKQQLIIDQETERLKKAFMQEQKEAEKQKKKHGGRASAPVVNHQGPFGGPPPGQFGRPPPQYPQVIPPPAQHYRPPPPQFQRPPVFNAPAPAGPYLQPMAGGHRPSASMSTFFGGSGLLRPDDGHRMGKESRRRSIFGLRSKSEESPTKLRKQTSTIF